MDGFKRALAYIQDFINIYGMKIWHEEFNRLMNSYIDMEARELTGMKLRIEDMDEDVPRPSKKYEDGKSFTFLGRLVNQLKLLTAPKKHVYVDSCKAFYNLKTQKMTISTKNIALMHKCIGVSGMNGVDKLLSFWIMKKLRKV